jgi:probable rRNA maturation factor
MSDNITVDISVASSADDIPAEKDVIEWVSRTVSRVLVGESAEVSVRIVDEEEGGKLNERYRDKSGPTNVLSFPAETGVAELPPDMPRLLGDIVICAPVVAREAVAQGKPLDAHWAHMLVHGALHLLGFDHLDREQAEHMESAEKQILAQYGVTDPYAA